VALLSQGRTAAAQCGLFTHKPFPVIFEPHCSTELTQVQWRGFIYFLGQSIQVQINLFGVFWDYTLAYICVDHNL
jgi:hypothetical protein